VHVLRFIPVSWKPAKALAPVIWKRRQLRQINAFRKAHGTHHSAQGWLRRRSEGERQMKLDPFTQGLLGFLAFPFLFFAFLMAISPFMNWLNGYGFVWIF
jgi:hypothetical protein